MPKRKASDSAEIESDRLVNGSKQKRLQSNVKDKLVANANALSAPQFSKHYINNEMLRYSAKSNDTAQTFLISFKSSSQLTSDEFNACFNVIKSTSQPDYETSGWGWHPRRKKREMKEDEMRYLLVRPCVTSGQCENMTDGDVQGFLSFMLTYDSTPSVPVTYVYEIHLTKPLRKLGLGAHLMDIIEGIAEKVGVDKLMLTCFWSNQKAHNFYEQRGYVTDVCSPEDRVTRGKSIRADYVIMSKLVPKAHFVSG